MKTNPTFVRVLVATVAVCGGVLMLPVDALAAEPMEFTQEVLGEYVASFVNFGIYLAIIVFGAGAMIQGYYRKRRDKLTAGIREAAEMREEAQQRLDEYTRRLDAFEDEREKLLDEFRQIGSRERDRLVAEGREQAERIRSDAKVAAEMELRRARRQLEQELLDRAFEVARDEVVRGLTPDAQRALIEASIREVQDASSSAPSTH